MLENRSGDNDLLELMGSGRFLHCRHQAFVATSFGEVVLDLEH